MRNIYVLVLLSSISSSFISVSADTGHSNDDNTANPDNSETLLGENGHGTRHTGGMPGANGRGTYNPNQSIKDS